MRLSAVPLHWPESLPTMMMTTMSEEETQYEAENCQREL